VHTRFTRAAIVSLVNTEDDRGLATNRAGRSALSAALAMRPTLANTVGDRLADIGDTEDHYDASTTEPENQ
jgi:hypothetical protein